MSLPFIFCKAPKSILMVSALWSLGSPLPLDESISFPLPHWTQGLMTLSPPIPSALGVDILCR